MLIFSINISFAADIGEKIEATTASSDKVISNPNGRWKHIDANKAAAADRIAKQYPENIGCPPDAQGGWFSTKSILPRDKAFNQKSQLGK